MKNSCDVFGHEYHEVTGKCHYCDRVIPMPVKVKRPARTKMTAADFAKTLATLRSDHTPVADKVALMNALHPALSAVFDKVRPASHWKDPIDTVVLLDALELAMIGYAVEFFTATTPTVTFVGVTAGGPRYHVTADGYRAGPAGDH